MTATTTGEATPRPWHIAGDSGNEGEAEIIESETRGIGWTQDTWDHAQDEAVITAEDRANGALIVKAVNAHDALMGWTAAYRDHLAGVHGKCDMDDDEHCRAEEYGDGNVGEHEDYRQVSADLKQVYNAAKGETR